MFKVFIHRRIHGNLKNSSAKHSSLPEKGASTENNDSSNTRVPKNRRQSERFTIDAKQLAVFNEQDILFIRDLSEDGFSSIVSDRAFERFEIGDGYVSRLSHLGQSYDLTVEVAWKNENLIGFRFRKMPVESIRLVQRLITPARLASTLVKVDAAFMETNRIWYHGEEQTDLFIWQSNRNSIDAWEFSSGSIFVTWDPDRLFRTGAQKAADVSDTGLISDQQLLKIFDESPKQESIQFALDVITASNCEEKDLLTEEFQPIGASNIR